jgi:hypothetical protein
MAREKKDQAPEGAETGNAVENAGTPPDEPAPKGEEEQKGQGEQGEGLAPPGQGESGSPPAPPARGKTAVVSESRKGKTIFAVSGEPIVFDNEGKAAVNEEDALYLKGCPGFIVG